MVKSLRTRKVVVAATTAVSLAAGAGAPAQASAIQDAYYAHTRMCIGLFFTDHEAHAELCAPNLMPNPLPDQGSGGDGILVVAPPAPPPSVTPPSSSYPNVSSSYPNVSSSYPNVASNFPDVGSGARG